jgi:galactosyl transferase GMA12/MNN10 family
LVFFKIAVPFVERQTNQELHPVWGRIPATVKMMQQFPQAEYFLYMDSDAILAQSRFTPTDMYHILAYDGYGDKATMEHKCPGLIVNKPMTGWPCIQCERFGMGHGCINSGVLLWRRSEAANVVLRVWWDSRKDSSTQNFFIKDANGVEDHFFGWSRPDGADVLEKMGEQNRLHFIYNSSKTVRDAIWIVPKQISDAYKSSSCPNAMDEGHTPCLQNDFIDVKWNSTGPSCFVNHYAGENKKTKLLDVLEEVLIAYNKSLVEENKGSKKEATKTSTEETVKPSKMEADKPSMVSKKSSIPSTNFSTRVLPESDYNRWSFNRRMEILEKSTPVYWDARREFPLLLELLANEIDYAFGAESVEIWRNSTRDFIFTERMCTAARDFRLAGSEKKHVAIMHLNENWGAFSGYVPNKTGNWGTYPSILGTCASHNDIWSYLNHSNTFAIVTDQFQHINHPKVHSIPLGLSTELKSTPSVDQFSERTQLLMVNAHDGLERSVGIQTAIRNFNGTVKNTYGNLENYISELSRSKFILSPAGFGWDCYRNWEALIYGAIPIIEHYNRTDGWFRTFEGLPVVLVSTFDEVTPEFLNSEYERLSKSRDYTFEKLSTEYWIDFVRSLAPSKQNQL